MGVGRRSRRPSSPIVGPGAELRVLSKDITPIIEGWDHEPDDLQVRLIRGLDGQEKLQMRLDLGLLQMELDGRPDGVKPHGHESLLVHHESRAAEQGGDYRLDADDCSALMREGVQYYHRYLALFHLSRYDLVARDTARNLRLFAFVKSHAQRKSDALMFDQYRPYVTMMRARALGCRAMERGDHLEALKHIDDGINGIKTFLRDYEQSDREATCQELIFLQRWRAEIESERPRDARERLSEQLQRAIDREDYEDAARIRDQLGRLSSPDSVG